MGLIFGNQPVETKDVAGEVPQEAVKEAVSAEQSAGQADAPSDDIALQQEAEKPVRRGRKRK